MKLNLNFSTHSLPLKWFAYLGKIFATILSVAFGTFYLVPAVQVSTNLPLSIIFVLILVFMLVSDMILHFSFASFVAGFWAGQFRITDFFGVLFSGVIVGYVSIHSTEKSFLKNVGGLTNLDSLQKVQDFEQKKLVQNYESQLQKLESVTLPALQNLQTQNQWAYLSALKVYESNRNNINSEKNESLTKLEKIQKSIFLKAEIHNQTTKQKHEKSQKQDTENAKYLGWFLLFFSIYNTFVIGTYQKKIAVPKVQNEVSEVQTEVPIQVSGVSEVPNDLKILETNVLQSVPQVQNTIVTEQTALQNQTQININISTPTPPKEKSPSIPKAETDTEEEVEDEKILTPSERDKAKNYILANMDMKDKYLRIEAMKKFKIARGTYYRIKSELTNKLKIH